MPAPVVNEAVSVGVQYLDEHVLVVHKRAGLVTQPGKGHEDDALLNGVFALEDGRLGKQLTNLGAARDYGLLHRLDRETSGLVVLARTADAYDALRAQFEARTIRKFYWAITAKAPSTDAGVINKPIAESEPKGGSGPGAWRHVGEKKLARIHGRGKDAQTAYRVLAISAIGRQAGALLECRPLTGRLHQVRVHLEAIGCPIAGDGLYASAAVAGLSPRLALHAWRLSFTHPISGATVDVRSAFPKELKGTAKRMRLELPADEV
jgi:23S rRNA pseudouridine1911/1915/1917 synthase